MIIEQITSIKKQTRLALPEDDLYLYRLGIALYGFASITSFIIEIICHIDDTKNRDFFSKKTSGSVLDIFVKTLEKIKLEIKFTEIHNIMQNTADLFKKLNKQRIDFIHSCPITNKKNEQILYRQIAKEKPFEVDNDFLDKFIGELHDVSDGLYNIRKVVKPGLDK